MAGDRLTSGALARGGCALAGIVSGALLLSILFHHPGWLTVATLGGLVLVAAAAPLTALLLIAGLAPLTTMIVAVAGDASAIRAGEAVMLAFLAGACARRASESRPFSVPARVGWTAGILVAAAFASALVQAWVLRAEQPALTLGGVLPIVLVRDYLILPNPFAVALQFAEGILLCVLACEACAGDAGRRDRVVRLVVIAAAAAGMLNVLRVVIAALPQERFWMALADLAMSVRVNVHFADWNAAGSYFAMALVLAAGYAGRRVAAWLLALPIVLALWLTGSRTALGAVLLIACAAAVVVIARLGLRRSVAALAVLGIVVVIGAAGWRWYPEQRNDSVAFSFSTRMALSKAGLRMAADYPVFGAGAGQYYPLSKEYAGDVLASFGRERENAHNQFVQVLAEFGVPALLLFLALIAFALRAGWPEAGAPLHAWALPAAVLAFLLTCLLGHPLVVPDASYPFWIVMGLTAVTPRPGPALRGWMGALAIIMMVVYLASVPTRATSAVRHANLENTSEGMSQWQREPDGTRYRWAGPRATFHLASSAVAMRIPLRHGPDGPPALLARVFLDGQEADRVQVRAGEPWHIVRFVTWGRGRGNFVRIDVEVTAADGGAATGERLLEIGQPGTIWSEGDVAAPTVDVPLLGDLDGDGKADFVVWSVQTGTWRWLPSGARYDDLAVASQSWAGQALGSVPLLDDLDGDGRDDLVVWRPRTSTWHWLRSSTGYRADRAGTRRWDTQADDTVPLLADLDGDARADLILWRAATSTWFWISSANGYGGEALSIPTSVSTSLMRLPVTGDFDADGKSDLAVWSTPASGGARLEWIAPATGARGSLNWASRNSEDTPLLGDIDGDKRADPLAWRGSTGMWSWLSSAARYDASAEGHTQWGNRIYADVPLVADLDGDRAPDIVIWRASTRTWYWLTSSSQYRAPAAGLKPWKF